jgi:hypothetical protein
VTEKIPPDWEWQARTWRDAALKWHEAANAISQAWQADQTAREAENCQAWHAEHERQLAPDPG